MPQPINPNALQAGVDAHNAGDLAAAEALYLEVLRTSGGVYDALRLLAVIYQGRGKLSDAAAIAKAATLVNPGLVDGHALLGDILQTQGQYDAAAASYEVALERNPSHVASLTNLGNTLLKQGMHQAAIDSYRAALVLDTSNFAIHFNLATALVARRKYEDAEEHFRAALKLSPESAESHFGLAMLLLSHGDYQNGWGHYKYRWHLAWGAPALRDFDPPLWTGAEPLTGKAILLHAEQGLGDTIQFARYVDLVAAEGVTIFIEVQRSLRALFEVSFRGNVIVVERGAPTPTTDYHCPFLDLPRAFNTSVSTIPAGSPYLTAPPERVPAWSKLLATAHQPRIGFVWNANRVQDPVAQLNSQARSVPLTQFMRLLMLPGISAVSLQKELSSIESSQIDGSPSVLNVGPEFTDFGDTAAVIEQLDLIITVDTSVAHLAGALGRPVWVLLPYAADWRWMIDRSDSSWYPTARLFRQAKPDGWNNVINEVTDELKRKFSLNC